jgi:altronate hydrolase
MIKKEQIKTEYKKQFLEKSFSGYLRRDGLAGTRNYYLIIPTSMCASETASQIAGSIEGDKEVLEKFKDLDGVVSIPHTEGCGCDSTISIERLIRVLKGYLSHPNVGGALIVDLGCEQTNYQKLNPCLKPIIDSGLKSIDWVSIESSGGVEAARKKGKFIVRSRLAEVDAFKREDLPIQKLVLGTECGASDIFSGITANPLIGNVVDKLIYAKGSAILSEIPEMIGTFELLSPRFRNKEVAKKFKEIMDWYFDLAKKLGLRMEDNLVPKNIEGGLINSSMKSLGAVSKGGTTTIEDIIDYAEHIKRRGLSIMQGPGGDLESVTGMVASGANIICFSTGQGTPTGNAISPVIKIASNSQVFKRLSSDIDFNAGRLLDENREMDSLGDELLDLIIKVASGQETAAERLGQRQFQIWTAGKLPL